MYHETISTVAALAKAKISWLDRSRLGYLVAAGLAGAYVGMGIALIFAVGAPLAAAESPFQTLAMGASFGIALTLVILAGAELFTGNNLVMTVGWLEKKVGGRDLARVWAWAWCGNLLGSLLLAKLVDLSGCLLAAAPLIERVALRKMAAPAHQLFFSAVLCNWLVCLAVWMAMRTKSDAAKCIAIFWCLFAFIACGYEHSVANMTLLSLGLLGPHTGTLTWLGLFRNLWWVTLGNILGGSLLVAGAYWLASTRGQGEARDA